MQDSTDIRITYFAIRERAEQCARDAMPDLPKVSTAESWESYITDLEAIDSYGVAHESADWDWVIYHGRAMELCQAVPTSVLHEAESQWDDINTNKPAGLYELASDLAFLVVVQEIVDAIEQVREELLELANDKLDQLESESV